MGVKQVSRDAHEADEAKWRTPVGQRYAEPWNEPDPLNTLSAREADEFFPESRSDRHATVCFGIFATLIWLAAGYFGYRLQYNWMFVAGSILTLIAVAHTIAGHERALE